MDINLALFLETNPEGRCTCRSAAGKVFRLHKSHQLESDGCWITSIMAGCWQFLQRGWCNVNDATSFLGPVNCCLRRKIEFRKNPVSFLIKREIHNESLIAQFLTRILLHANNTWDLATDCVNVIMFLGVTFQTLCVVLFC